MEPSHDGAPVPSLTETAPDLRIEIWRDEHAEYNGTAAQLQAEGLIPNDFEWPCAAHSQCWQADGFHYSLRRTRPAGHKGPMRSWLELDNWSVRVEVNGRDCHWHIRQRLKRQAEELAAAHHHFSRAGQIERAAKWERYQAAMNDMAFLEFKEKIPALTVQKRGRKPVRQ